MDKPVKVKDAPGLVWKKRSYGYEARWQARTDLIDRGFYPKSERLWGLPGEPTAVEWNFIADRCRMLQSEMLIWARGGLPIPASRFTGTIASLIECYQTDPDSTYRKLRYGSRVGNDFLTRRLAKEHGHEHLRDLRARTFNRWYEVWTEGDKHAMGHALITNLRTLIRFGYTILEDEDCQRLADILHNMKFSGAKARAERITAAQVDDVRAKAHELGWHSVALVQAIQFECALRQKDVLGEWVPMAEPGLSDVKDGSWKWVRGLQWGQIDQNWMLRHVTSKKLKPITINLTKAPMVVEEFNRQFPNGIPSRGPIAIKDGSNIPWRAHDFRRKWRDAAMAADIPKKVWNMDSRAGAISEALLAGASLDSVRKAATHSNVSTTQRYSRGDDEAIESVQEARNKSRTK